MTTSSRISRASRVLIGAVTLAMAFSLGAVFVTHSQSEADTFYACLQRNGNLYAVNTVEQPSCRGNDEAVSWTSFDADVLANYVATTDEGIVTTDMLADGSVTLDKLEEGLLDFEDGLDEELLELIKCAALPKPHVDLSGCDLSGADLRFANLDSANLSGANLQQANLSGMQFSDVDFSQANLSEANLNEIFAGNTDFNGANLSDASLEGAVAANSDFRGADLSGATVVQAAVDGSDFTGADFTNAAFLFTYLDELAEVVLDDVIWDNTLCPSGVNSNDNNGTCLGQLEPPPIIPEF